MSFLKYRPDIDGLRAIAVLGVVFYHAMANLAPAWGSAIPTLVLTFVLAKLMRDSAQKPKPLMA